jgi:ABC-type dipeptide/oligopeptide/nickel transport system permease component
MSPVAVLLARRAGQAVVTLLLATLLFQLALELLPGDPIRALFGPQRPDPVVYEAMRAQYGFDEPFPVRYLGYLGDLVTGDWGNSFPGGLVYGRVEVGPPVRDVVAAALPVSATLVAWAVLVQGVVGLAAGACAVLLRRPAAGSVIYLAAVGTASVPVIVLAYGLQAFVGTELRWLPVTGAGHGWRGYVLPVVALAAAATAYLALLTRSELAETLRARWVKAAEARSIPQHRIVGIHAMRVSLVPIVTFLAANTGQLLTALVIVEGVFGVPGVGGALFSAVQTRDPAMLTALLTLSVAVVVAANLVADVVVAVADPRVRAAR